MKNQAARLTALIVLSWSSLAAAGPAVDAATQAEALQAEGKAVEALAALAEAVDAVWSAGPLAFRKVVVVNSSDGFGIYEERPAAAFKPDEIMTVYVEPVGYGYGAGASTIAFKTDLAFENATGQVLGESKDVFSLAIAGAPGQREFSMALSFGVPYLRPGEYKAVFTVHDQNSAKTGTFDVPLTIAAPGG